MAININYINDFILFLENTINEIFIDEICEENMGQFVIMKKRNLI